MNMFTLIADGVRRELQAEKIFGVVVGLVSNNKDEDGMNRVKVTFPWLSEDEESHWARVSCLMAGEKRGALFLPEVGDEVLVAFEHGDIDRPYVIGSLWNGVDKPPLTNDDGKNNIRLIQSRSGHKVTLDDTDGSEKISVEDKSGKNSIVWDTASNTITITADKDIMLSAPSGTITLDAKELAIKSSGDAKVEAGGSMTLKGSTIDIN
jgi:uncharacterized protein involved in type VI secretion and phage assembly